jgi:hypothetical protein
MPRSGHPIHNHYTRKCFDTIGDSVSYVSILDAATVWLHEQCLNTLTQSQGLIRLAA